MGRVPGLTIVGLSTLLAFSNPASAQLASVRGNVLTSTNIPIPGVTVYLVHSIAGRSYPYETDSSGAYVFSNVPPRDDPYFLELYWGSELIYRQPVPSPIRRGTTLSLPPIVLSSSGVPPASESRKGTTTSEVTKITVLKVLASSGPFDEFVRSLVRAEPEPVYLVSAGANSSNDRAVRVRRELQSKLSQQPKYIVEVVRSPFQEAGRLYYVLIGSPSTRKSRAPRFILNSLKSLAFKDGAEAQEVGKTIGKLLDIEVQNAGFVE